ncbi:MAG: abortive infection family protein, partial [bacterium]|nr:abortive infection family protein [bacterium]
RPSRKQEGRGFQPSGRTLSNLAQVVTGVAEVRNLYGTGHGRSKAPEPDVAHARLVVNAAVTVATFLLEVWQGRKRDRDDSATAHNGHG